MWPSVVYFFCAGRIAVPLDGLQEGQQTDDLKDHDLQDVPNAVAPPAPAPVVTAPDSDYIVMTKKGQNASDVRLCKLLTPM